MTILKFMSSTDWLNFLCYVLHVECIFLTDWQSRVVGWFWPCPSFARLKFRHTHVDVVSVKWSCLRIFIRQANTRKDENAIASMQ